MVAAREPGSFLAKLAGCSAKASLSVSPPMTRVSDFSTQDLVPVGFGFVMRLELA